jgi:formylglycine-generating enzyme required for sulfatase activity
MHNTQILDRLLSSKPPQNSEESQKQDINGEKHTDESPLTQQEQEELEAYADYLQKQQERYQEHYDSSEKTRHVPT